MQNTAFIDSTIKAGAGLTRYLGPVDVGNDGLDTLAVAYSGCDIVSQRRQTWGPVRAVLTELRGNGAVSIAIDGDGGCLSCFLETVGTPVAFAETGVRQTGRDREDAARPMAFIPAGRMVEGRADGLVFARHLVLEFSTDMLRQTLEPRQLGDISDLRLGFADPCLLQLCEIFAGEALNGRAGGDLFASGLGTALVTRLAVVETTRRSEQGGLAPWQHRRVVDYMMARLGELVSLDELAALVQLSRSYFCRAFKATVGVTPYQWQLNARVHHAKSLILKGDMPLAQIALEAGFADQAHFTRVFRKFEGVCPGQWMRSNRAERATALIAA